MKSIFAGLLMLMMGSVPAWAVLGGDVSSVDADVQVLRGQHVVLAKAGYSVHQITMSDRSVVNEFVSPAGTVFGISWSSRSMPNLQQLLGTHMTDLQQGQRTQVVPRRAVTIQGNNFVYSSFGTTRFFRGHVYVPGLVPANVSAEVVQ